MAPTEQLEAPVATGTRAGIVLQPIVDLGTGRVAGFEALARFCGPDGTPLNTQEVFARGVAPEVELALIRTALARMPALPGATYLSVNASGPVFSDPRLLTTIDASIRLGVDPGRIVVELTETGDRRMHNARRTRKALAERGIRVAIDDYGTGYSGMARVAALQPDVVKLDRSHVTGIGESAALRSILAQVIAQPLRWAMVVAEGIESQRDVEGLLAIGVRYGQGYYLGIPGPVPVMNQPVERRRLARPAAAVEARSVA